MFTRRDQSAHLSWTLALLLFWMGGCSSRALSSTDDAAPGSPSPGDSGTPVDSRSAGDGGSPDAGLDRKAQIIRACALASMSHIWEAGAFSVSECIDWFTLEHGPSLTEHTGWDHLAAPMLERLLSCTPGDTAREGTTEEFRECFGGNWIAGNGCRVEGRCEDGRVIRHFDNEALFFDCGAIGGSCVDMMTSLIWACCTLESCAPGAEYLPPACDGDRGEQCLAGMEGRGVLRRFDCAPAGATCSPEQHYTPCVGVGAPCDPTQGMSCDGSIATFCANGRLAEIDCAGIPTRSACDPDGTSRSPCRGAGDECDSGFRGACNDGGELVFCYDGRFETIDCREVGGEFCVDSPLQSPHPFCGVIGP